MAIAARCTLCDYEVSQEVLDKGLNCCPGCGATGIPCDPANDVHIKINWHELRILGIWAENWARRHLEETGYDYEGLKVVHAIARRIQAQHPDGTPLTLAGKIREIRQTGYSVETNFDAREHLVFRTKEGYVSQQELERLREVAREPGRIVADTDEAGVNLTSAYDLLDALRSQVPNINTASDLNDFLGRIQQIFEEVEAQFLRITELREGEN